METIINHEFTPSSKKGIENMAPVKHAFDTGDLTKITLDGKALPVESVNFLLHYGLKQKLSDSYSAHKDRADFDKMLGDCVTALIEGKVAIRIGGGGKAKDPLETLRDSFAKTFLKREAEAQEMALPKVSTDEYKTMLAAVREAYAEEIEAEVKAHQERKSGLKLKGIALPVKAKGKE